MEALSGQMASVNMAFVSSESVHIDQAGKKWRMLVTRDQSRTKLALHTVTMMLYAGNRTEREFNATKLNSIYFNFTKNLPIQERWINLN